MNNFDKAKINSLIKITGRSHISLKNKPVYLILDRIQNKYQYKFYLLSDTGEKFWVDFDKSKPYGGIYILS